jgi:4-hydroxythreonine-4-phosphate dehydrogenase
VHGTPRLALTPGEPAGIGPDLVIELLLGDPLDAGILVFADPDALARRAALLGRSIAIETVAPGQPVPLHAPGTIHVRHVPLAVPAEPGRTDPRNARAVVEAIRLATESCLAGELDAMVTGPVNKAVINDAGIPFTGHTEFIAEVCGGAMPVMMLMGGTLRVALATTHLPLARVSAAVTREGLESVIRIVHGDLVRRFGIASPRLSVLGMNPHAGEQGHLGREEIDVIGPVLARLRAEGMDLTGPVPADTAFTPGSLAGIDAVVAMYHDQGLPPLKALAFGQVVNVTLGLPVVRTSVDHGTALSLAGTGRARVDSLRAAVECARFLAQGASRDPVKRRPA